MMMAVLNILPSITSREVAALIPLTLSLSRMRQKGWRISSFKQEIDFK